MNGFSQSLKRHMNQILLILSIISLYIISYIIPRTASKISRSLLGYYTLLALFSLGTVAVLGTLYIYTQKPRDTIKRKTQINAFTTGLVLAGISYILFLGLARVIYSIGSIVFGGITYVLFWLYTLSIGLTFSLIIKMVESLIYNEEDDKSLLALISGGIISALYIVSPGTIYISTLILLFGIGIAATLVYQKYGLLSSTGFIATIYLAWSMSPIQFNGPVLAHSILATAVIITVVYMSTSLSKKQLIDYRRNLSWKTLLVVGLLIVSIIAILAGLSNGYRAYVVVTGSMEPTLSIGDLVIVAPKPHYETGDIISYKYNGVVITHRIYDLSDDESLRTKGDANAEPDPYLIQDDDIIGSVKHRIPKIGWFIILLNWNQYIKLLVITISVIIMYRLLAGTD